LEIFRLFVGKGAARGYNWSADFPRFFDIRMTSVDSPDPGVYEPFFDRLGLQNKEAGFDPPTKESSMLGS